MALPRPRPASAPCQRQRPGVPGPLPADRAGIHPAGEPWQNGYIESFFGKLRDELLSCEDFGCGSELQCALDNFQEHYNNQRPHLGLGGMTPAKFKKGLLTQKKNEVKQEAILGV
jgi:hypothetical protein